MSTDRTRPCVLLCILCVSLAVEQELTINRCGPVIDEFVFGLHLAAGDDGSKYFTKHDPSVHEETRLAHEVYFACVNFLKDRPKEYLPKGTLAVPGRDYPTVLVKLPTTGRLFMVPAFDMVIGGFAKLTGSYDLAEEEILQRLVKVGEKVIEIGSNIGVYTVALADRVGPRGLVYAFEPFRQIFHILNANIALHGFGNVLTRQYAFSSKESFQRVRAPSLQEFTNLGAIRVFFQQEFEIAHVPYNGTEIIDVRRLDGIGLECCDLIKIDVEGMELEVVQGSVGYIHECQPIIYAENQGYKDKDFRFIEYMNTVGYHCGPIAMLKIHDIMVCFPHSRQADIHARLHPE